MSQKRDQHLLTSLMAAAASRLEEVEQSNHLSPMIAASRKRQKRDPIARSHARKAKRRHRNNHP